MAKGIRIGSLAKRAGVTTRTIKYYEELGLLEPAGKTEGGFRIFDERDVAAVEVIRKMRAVGLSLHAINEVLALRQTVSGLDTKPMPVMQVEQLINHLEDRLSHVDENIRRLEEDLRQGKALQHDLRNDIQICRRYLDKKRRDAEHLSPKDS